MARKEDQESEKEQAQLPPRGEGNAAGANGHEQGQRQARKAAEQMTDQAAQSGQQFLGAAQEALQRPVEQWQSMMGIGGNPYRDVAESSRNDLEAVMQSGACLAKGVQDIGWELMQYAQQGLKLQMRAANQWLECRSFEDIVGLQRAYMRETIDSFLDGSAKILALGSQVTSNAVDSLSQRVADQQRWQKMRESGEETLRAFTPPRSQSSGEEMRH